MTEFQKARERYRKRVEKKTVQRKKEQITTKKYNTDENKLKLYKEMLKDSNISIRFINKNMKNYKVDPLNQGVFKKVKYYLENYSEMEEEGKWLVMTGECGTGKTHLAIAMLKLICYKYAVRCVEKFADFPLPYYRDKIIMKPVYFAKTTELFEEIKSSYEYDDVLESDVIAKYKYKKLLVIDDLGTEKPSDFTRDRLYSILDYRYSHMKPTIITTNYDMEELTRRIDEKGKPRIVDRIQEAADEYIIGWRGESHRAKEE